MRILRFIKWSPLFLFLGFLLFPVALAFLPETNSPRLQNLQLLEGSDKSWLFVEVLCRTTRPGPLASPPFIDTLLEFHAFEITGEGEIQDFAMNARESGEWNLEDATPFMHDNRFYLFIDQSLLDTPLFRLGVNGFEKLSPEEAEEFLDTHGLGRNTSYVLRRERMDAMTTASGFRRRLEDRFGLSIGESIEVELFKGNVRIEIDRDEAAIRICMKRRTGQQTAKTLLEIPSDYCERFQEVQVPESR